MTDSPPAMTVRDVAAYLNVNEKTVYRLAQRRELPGFKVAGAWRFRKRDIDEWIDDRKSAGASANGDSGGPAEPRDSLQNSDRNEGSQR